MTGAPRNGAARVSLVILSYNRAEQLLRTVARSAALPERPPIVVVDNGSADGSAQRVRAAFPHVRLIALPRNFGAAARNVGAGVAATPYVAFGDDDTAWEPGSLARAAGLLDAHPRIALLCARVLVGARRREDPVCRAMAQSPLPADGLPGPALLGFRAGACVMRRAAFFKVGGFEPRFLIGGEEALIALDLASRGWSLVYAPQLTVQHDPSPQRDAALRRRLLLRNALWTAWLRRPWPGALRQTARLLWAAMPQPELRAGTWEALRGLPWALWRRRAVPPAVEAWCRLLEEAEAAGARLPVATTARPAD